MKKSTLDAEDILYSYVAESSLKTAVTTTSGEVFKGRKPINYQKEAVEIISLPINNEDIQEGIVNINIHVPNLLINQNNVQDPSQPNHPRLQELTNLALGILNDVFIPASDCGFEVMQQTLIQDEEGGAYYSNIRVRFYNINLN